MTIETKFKPRDHVWTIHANYNKYIPTDIKCSFCNGTGYVENTRCFAKDGFRSKCIDGVINKIEIQHSIKEHVIEKVGVLIETYNTETEYTLENDCIYCESELYATLEEAEVECIRRNTTKN